MGRFRAPGGENGRAAGRRAFTLVELLVVVSVVAVLAALLMPAVARARYQATVAVCADRQRQLVVAVLAFANDNGGSLPRQDMTNTHTRGQNAWDVDNTFYNVMTRQYRVPVEALSCPTLPADLPQFDHFKVLGYMYWVPRKLNSAVIPPDPPSTGGVYPAGTGIVRGPTKMTDLKALANPVFTDIAATDQRSDPLADLATMAPERLHQRSSHRWNGRMESANQAFLDGHVERVPASALRARYHAKPANASEWSWNWR